MLTEALSLHVGGLKRECIEAELAGLIKGIAAEEKSLEVPSTFPFGVAPSHLNESAVISASSSPMISSEDHLQLLQNQYTNNLSSMSFLMENILGITSAVKHSLTRCHNLEQKNQGVTRQIRKLMAKGASSKCESTSEMTDADFMEGAPCYDHEDIESRSQLLRLLSQLEEEVKVTCTQYSMPLQTQEHKPTSSLSSSSIPDWVRVAEVAVTESAIDRVSSEGNEQQSSSSPDDEEDAEVGAENTEATRRRRRKNINGSERARRRRIKQREAQAAEARDREVQALAQTIARVQAPRR